MYNIWLTNTNIVASPEDGAQKVNQYVDMGADLVKIVIDSGEAMRITRPTLSLEEASAIVQAAHQRGVKVSSHTTTEQDLPTLLDAGVDDIAHMSTVPVRDSLIERIVRANVYWVPTLEQSKRNSSGQGIKIGKSNLLRFVAAGGKVALGTDYNGDGRPGWEDGMPMIEIQEMRDAGMTPMQIIVAATKNAAFVCNLDHELGTIEVGKIADVLVVDGNPLQDLGVLTNVRLVIHNGAVIRETR